jgi:hypothetical protein
VGFSPWGMLARLTVRNKRTLKGVIPFAGMTPFTYSIDSLSAPYGSVLQAASVAEFAAPGK